MKFFFAKASLFCLILLTFSCAKETVYLQAGGENAAPAKFTAKIKGVTVNLDKATKAIYNVLDKKTVEIVAYDDKGKMMGFVIDDFKGAGTYNINETMLTTFSYIGDAEDFETFYISNAGKITITAFGDKLITGKFEVVANNGSEDINITNGEFSVDLATAPVHEHLGDNKFNAKLNGTLTGFKGQAVSAGVLNVIGMYGTKSMTLSLPSFNGARTYQLSNSFLGDRISYYPDGDASEYVSTSGSVIVTSVANNTIKGTFTGTLKDENGTTITVTDGSFEIKDFQ